MLKTLCATLLCCLLTLQAVAVQTTSQQPVQNGQAAAAAPDDKPRVFITDSESWETRGAAGGTGGTFGAEMHGGARPQTAEIIKTFGEKCPGVTTNNMREKANYVVVLDHEGGKGYLRHRNKVAVFDAQTGDSVISKSTLSLGGSVEEACSGIMKHWGSRKAISGTDAVAPVKVQLASAVVSPPAEPVVSRPVGRLSITSLPDGAEIEIDGSFMGNAPSSLQLDAGEHIVAVKKSGFKTWQRKLKVSGGEVSIKAELEKESEASK